MSNYEYKGGTWYTDYDDNFNQINNGFQTSFKIDHERWFYTVVCSNEVLDKNGKQCIRVVVLISNNFSSKIDNPDQYIEVSKLSEWVTNHIRNDMFTRQKDFLESACGDLVFEVAIADLIDHVTDVTHFNTLIKEEGCNCEDYIKCLLGSLPLPKKVEQDVFDRTFSVSTLRGGKHKEWTLVELDGFIYKNYGVSVMSVFNKYKKDYLSSS